MLIYLAKPIDKVEGSLNSDRLRKATNAITEYIHSSSRDLVLYDPQSAFRMGRNAVPTSQINHINYNAIEAADQLLVLWPKGVKSWGVPAEVHEAMRENKPVTIVTQEDTTWAMQYSKLQVIRAQSENIEHWVSAVRRAMNQIVDGVGELTVNGSITEIDLSKLKMLNTRQVTRLVADSLGIPECDNPSCRIHGDGTPETETKALEETPDTLTPWKEGSVGSPVTLGDQGGTETAQSVSMSSLVPWSREVPLPVRAVNGAHYMKKPTRGHQDDAGLDLYVSDNVIIQPGSFLDVPTNTAVKLPEGSWGFLVGRSSTLRTKGLMVNPGIIDVGYTGELYCAVWNLGDTPVRLNRGERVSQLIILPNGTLNQNPVQVEEFEGTTARGEKGFGSTGA